MKEREPEFFLRELLSIDTQNPPGKEAQIVQFIIREMGLKKEQYEILDHGGGRASLIVSIPGNSKDTVLFLGHLDTVPCGDSAAWQYPPIQATEKEGCLYGLGSSDMKSGVAIMLVLLQKVLQWKTKPQKTIRFVFTADEESQCAGSKAVAQCAWMNEVTEILLSEPTDGKTVIAEKGVLWITLGIVGRQAHGAMPEEARNGNEFLWKAIEQMREEMEELEVSKVLGKTSISTTVFQGGFKSNIIPGTAEAVLDIRTVAASNHRQIKEYLEKLQKEFYQKYQVKLHFEIQNEKMVLEESKKAMLVQKWMSLEKIERQPEGIPYYTDLAELLKNHQSEFIICGPGKIKKMHNIDEYVELAKLHEVTEKYITFLNQFC